MSFCEIDITDYITIYCGIDYAGIVGIGIIDKDENPSEEALQDPEFWSNVVGNGKYFVIRNTRGEYNGGEEIIQDDLLGPIVTGANHSAKIDSTALIENFKYWDAIQKKHWKIVLVNAGGLMFYVQNPVSIYTKIINPKEIKTLAYFESEFKWFDLSNPVILDAPDGIFYGTIPVFTEGLFDYTFDMSFE